MSHEGGVKMRSRQHVLSGHLPKIVCQRVPVFNCSVFESLGGGGGGGRKPCHLKDTFLCSYLPDLLDVEMVNGIDYDLWALEKWFDIDTSSNCLERICSNPLLYLHLYTICCSKVVSNETICETFSKLQAAFPCK